VKISNKKFSFFPSLNQYFPHIPYVASKKAMTKIRSFNNNEFVDDIDNGDYSDNKDYIDYNIREGFENLLSEFASNVQNVSRFLDF
jgi:hypothetical protein